MLTTLLDITVISKEFTDILNVLKPIFLGVIFLISIGWATYQAYVGGQDKRVIINTLIGMFIVAIIIYSADKIIVWLARIAG